MDCSVFCVLYAQYRPSKIMFITPRQYMGLGIIMMCLGALLLFLSDLTNR